MDILTAIKQNKLDSIDILKELSNEIENMSGSVSINKNNDKEYSELQIDAYEQIKKARAEKEGFFEGRVESRVYAFHVSKIYSYNELFKMNLKGGRVVVEHNETYNKYKEEIKKEFIRNNKDGKLSQILNSPAILFKVDFLISHSGRDLDNITSSFQNVFNDLTNLDLTSNKEVPENIEKAFIDTLFFNAGVKDNIIKNLMQSKSVKNDDSKEEIIFFQVIALHSFDYEQSSLIKKYLQQELTNKI